MATRRDGRKTLARVLLALGTAVLGLPLLATQAAAQDNVTNPDLGAACGLDLTLILDRSGSIGSNNDEVADAGQAIIDALEGTGGRVKVIRFSNTAEGLGATGSGSQGSHYTDDIAQVTFRDPATVTLPPAGFSSSGGTNWDDALEVARRSPGGPGPLTIFVTDGDPTYRNSRASDNGVAENGHGTGLSGDGMTVSTNNLGEAEDEADALQRPVGQGGAGSHVFVVGVGSALSNTASQNRLQRISGPQRLEGPNGTLGDADDNSFATADYTLVTDFAALAARMRGVITELCSPSLNVRKLVIPAGGAAGDATPSAGWSISATATSYVPSSWQSPAGASGATATATTGANGFANFKWEPPTATPAARTNISFTETLQPGYVFESISCSRNSFDGSPQQPVAVSGPTINGNVLTFTLTGNANNVGAEQAVNCTLTNRAITPSTIRVDKVTVPSLPSPGFDFQLRQGGAGGPVLQTLTGLTGPGQGAVAFATPVMPGTYSITETSVPSWSLSSATCTRPGLPTPVSATNLLVGEGQQWTCTFTNTAAPGSITIVKETSGAPVGTFDFTSTVPGHGSFSLTTTAVGGTSKGVASTTFTDVPVNGPGSSYSFAEVGTAGFTFTGATCDDGSPIGAVVVSPGEHVTCTFSNTAPAPTISVTKTPSTAAVPESGDDVTYTVRITNTSVEPLTLTSLGDTVEGAAATLPSLADMCGSDLVIPAGAHLDCTFTLPVSEADDIDGDDAVTDTVSVVAVDSDGTEATDEATAEVELTDVPATIAVEKVPLDESGDPAPGLQIPEPGGPVTYRVRVTNESTHDAVTITTLTDVTSSAPAVQLNLLTTSSSCATAFATPLPPSATRTCTFTVDVTGNPKTETDTVTASGVDDDGSPVSGSANATVEITDVKPVIDVEKVALTPVLDEPGGLAAFRVTITNRSVEPVTITSLRDAYGTTDLDLLTHAGLTCDGPLTLAAAGDAGDSIECDFTVDLGSQVPGSVTDTVTAIAVDDEQNQATDADQATVTVRDTVPEIIVTKTADPVSVPEPGGDVTFTVTVAAHPDNVEPVYLTSISDVVDGGAPFAVCEAELAAFNAGGGSLEPQGAPFTCTFTLWVAGNPADDGLVTDVVTVTGADDEGNPVTDDDDAEVTVTDVLPTVEVTKVATPGSVPEPGGDVSYLVTVRNTSAEPVTLTSLVDVPAFPVGSDCAVLAASQPVLPVDGEVSCTFTAPATGNAGDTVSDTVTAVVTDDEGNTGSDDATETVEITPVAPTISVTKTAVAVDGVATTDPDVPETGATVTYEVAITNTSGPSDPVTITAIEDLFDGAPLADLGGCEALIGTTILPGETVRCTYDVWVAGNAGDLVSNTVTVDVVDDEQTSADDDGTEVVDLVDVEPTLDVTKVALVGPGGAVDPTPSVPEPGADVTFRVTVTNTSGEPVTILSIADLVDGAELPLSADCLALVGTTLPVTGSASCEFTTFVGGNPAAMDPASVTDTIVVEYGDDEDPGQPDGTAQDSETVEIDDVPPVATVTKTPGTSSVAEPGAEVTFDVTVGNDSVETVTLVSLVDTVGGEDLDVLLPDLSPAVLASTCQAGTTIPAGGDYACSFTLLVSGNGGDVVADTVRAVVVDDEGGASEPTDSAEVGITDVPPTIEVEKEAVTGTLAAPGGPATFAVTVVNTSPEPVTVTSITDAVGDGTPFAVAGPDADARVLDTTCELGVVIPVGGAYECEFTLEVTSDEAAVETDQVVVVVVDDEQNEGTDSDTATTGITAVADLAIDKELVGALTDEGTYTLTVTNEGPSTAVGVVVTDELPAGLTATGAEGDGWTCAITGGGTLVTCTRPSLAPGDTTEIAIDVRVDRSLGGTTVTNTGEVTSSTPDPDPSNNRDTTTDRVTVIRVGGVQIPAQDPPAPPVASGVLPRTGAQILGFVGAGVALLGLGLGLELTRRRRPADG